jgi:hypothetical protein
LSSVGPTFLSCNSSKQPHLGVFIRCNC